MRLHDNPIQTKEEDFLDRGKFAQHLSKAILDWKQSQSIVIALCGEWGSGKSSVIKLAIDNIDAEDNGNKPIIIRFDPWAISEEGSLTKHFFNEIANNTDDKSAKLLREYGAALSDVPKIKFFYSTVKFIYGILEACGIIKIIRICGIIKICSMIFNDNCKIVRWVQSVIKVSALETKERIKENLKSNQKKMLIVIDDIDRLNQPEIKKIFQIIKANADFSNIIYLLSFDRKVVEKNLDEQKGVSGKDYMDKIVQVDFDIPVVHESKILHYFIEQLNQTLDKLPKKSMKKYFPENSPRWYEIYHSGLKDFFKNIRDVKRYINSLEFNLSQMHQNDVMEINPIDFIAIEAIRVFAPNFYLFMKNRRTLFTVILSETEEKVKRDEEIKKIIKEQLPEKFRDSVWGLTEILFPQLSLNDTYQVEHNPSEWTKDLMVCSEKIFDTYFTLIPGEGEDELSQFEIERILNSANSAEELEKILIEYANKEKIEKVLGRIGVFTNDEQMMPADNVKNIVQAFFNMSDGWQNMSDNMIGNPIPVMLHRLLKREPDKNTNLKILKEAILSSKGLFGPVEQTLCLISREEKRDSIVPKDKIEELQKLCIKKMEEFGVYNLLNHNSLGVFMRCWQEWGKKEGWEKFMSEVQKDEDNILVFIDNYAVKEFRYGGDKVSTERSFTPESYKTLSKFLDVKELKIKLEEIKELNPKLYENHKETIDMYLDDFDHKNGIEHETSA